MNILKTSFRFCPNCGGAVTHETAIAEGDIQGYEQIIAERCDICKWRRSLLGDTREEQLGQSIRGLKTIVAQLERQIKV